MKKLFFILVIINATNCLAQKTDDIQLANEYYINGELEKAGDLYEKLAETTKNIPIIHNNYFTLLLELREYKTADKYLKKIIKTFPQNVYYQIDKGVLIRQQGDLEESDKYFRQFIETNKGNEYKMRLAAQNFISKRYYEFAEEALLASRKTLKDDNKHALELANVYRFMGKKNEMIEEYLKFAQQRPSNLSYIKNIFQNILREEEDIVNFQTILIEKTQKEPNETMYPELLIWVNLQQKNFYAAFIQARSLDKRFKKQGQQVLQIGKIALQNNSFDDAIKMFQYVVDNSQQENFYHQARRLIVSAREQKLKNTYPIDRPALRQLTNDYQQLVNELGANNNTMEAYRSKALLHAFYLDEKDSAVSILNEIVTMPRISNQLRSKCKLDLGDIYVLTGEPWEATLLYSQVEKANKDSQLGYSAKLKNAQLNYYKGEFELAKSHLDILKLATTREIANDALSLSLLIQNNTVFDTSDYVMKEFAGIELLLFQHKKEEALLAFKNMLEKYPGHSLVDEIYWKMANINMELGHFEHAISQLDQITSRFATDILGDDAMFLTAQIYEQNLKDTEKAQEIYRDFLLKYPGSVFTAEARKRFRKLRGDQIF